VSDLPAPTFPVPYTRVIPGTQLLKQGVYLYECPLCKKRFRYDDPYEPICSGPSESRDDHPPEVMRLVSKVAPRLLVQGVPSTSEEQRYPMEVAIVIKPHVVHRVIRDCPPENVGPVKPLDRFHRSHKFP
jgi:hypothetical protein